MTKKLNMDLLQDELAGSAFFKAPVAPAELVRVAPNKWSSPQSQASGGPHSAGSAVEPTDTDSDGNTSEPVPVDEPSNERSDEATMQPTDVGATIQVAGRTKIRHSFDIYEDQLLSLREIALERERRSGTRVLLGALVREPLDNLIAAERSDERTNECSQRTNKDCAETSQH